MRAQHRSQPPQRARRPHDPGGRRGRANGQESGRGCNTLRPSTEQCVQAYGFGLGAQVLTRTQVRLGTEGAQPRGHDQPVRRQQPGVDERGSAIDDVVHHFPAYLPVIPKLHPPPTASRQLEFGDRHIASVAGVSGGKRSHLAPESASREFRRKTTRSPQDFCSKRLWPFRLYAGETGGLGDRSRNLSADTIGVEIDLVRRPFQDLLRSQPINLVFSYLSSRRTRGPTSVPYAYSIWAPTDLIPGGYAYRCAILCHATLRERGCRALRPAKRGRFMRYCAPVA
jgi:hypothetical protein